VRCDNKPASLHLPITRPAIGTALPVITQIGPYPVGPVPSLTHEAAQIMFTRADTPIQAAHPLRTCR
jgi:hypothetical protein